MDHLWGIVPGIQQTHPAKHMKKALFIVAITGLALTIVPSLLIHLAGVSLEDNKQIMLVGTIIWFVSIPWLVKGK